MINILTKRKSVGNIFPQTHNETETENEPNNAHDGCVLQMNASQQ